MICGSKMMTFRWMTWKELQCIAISVFPLRLMSGLENSQDSVPWRAFGPLEHITSEIWANRRACFVFYAKARFVSFWHFIAQVIWFTRPYISVNVHLVPELPNTYMMSTIFYSYVPESNEPPRPIWLIISSDDNVTDMTVVINWSFPPFPWCDDIRLQLSERFGSMELDP